jgi:hypothetical protein
MNSNFFRVTVGLGVICFVISLVLFIQHAAFEEGLLVSKISTGQVIEPVEYSVHGPRTYEFFAERYKFLTLFLFLYLIWKLFEKKEKILYQIINLTILVLVVNQLWKVLYWKLNRSRSTYWNEPYDIVLRESLPLDFICGGIILFLFVSQVSILTANILRKRKYDKDERPKSCEMV